MDGTSDEIHRTHIAFAIWVMCFLQVFTIKSMGVLLPVLLEQFATKTRTGGITVSLTFFSGTLIGLSAKVLTRAISKQALMIICGILSSIGLLINVSANTTGALVTGMFLTGFNSMGVVVAMGLVSTYFPIYQHVAANCIMTSLPLAITVSAPLTQLLLDTYGWHGTLLIITGLSMHYIVAARILKPLHDNGQLNKSLCTHQTPSRRRYNETNQDFCTHQYKKLEKSNGQNKDKSLCTHQYKTPDQSSYNETIQDFIKDIVNTSIMFNFQFQVVLITSYLSGYIYNGWVVYLVSIAQSKGLAPIYAANVATVGGIGATIVRIILAVLQGKSPHYRLLFNIGSLLILLSYIGMYFSSSFLCLSMFGLTIGLGYGIMGAQTIIAVNETVDPGDAVSGMAWAQLAQSIGYITSGFISGLLFDVTGTFSLTIIAQCAVSLTIPLMLGIEYIWYRVCNKCCYWNSKYQRDDS